MTLTARFGDERGTDPALVGGKAAALGALTRVGLPVPAGFAVTVDALRAVDAASGIVARLDARVAALPAGDVAAAEQVAVDAQHEWRDAALPASVEQALTGAYRQLAAALGEPHVAVAVRSSAVDEDGESTFAGEYESVLWVRETAALLAAVRRCWASLWTARAVIHRRERGTPTAPAMGLAVQQMVRPRVAGVAFTLDPSTGDRSRVAIDAAWGLGGVVAAGEVTPDSWRVDRVLHTITDRRISVKAVEHRCTSEGEVVTAPVEAARQTAPCLDDDEVLAVARLVEEVEARVGGAQDVEWAVDEGGRAPGALHLLQSRPETVWSRRSEHQPSAATTYTDPVAAVGRTLSTATEPQADARPMLEDEEPAGAAGWSAGFPPDLLFDPASRAEDESHFWFHDAVHWSAVVTPWEATLLTRTIAALSDAADRRHVLPASRGVRVRVHRGYVYLSPIAVDDPADVAARLPEFERLAREHYAHWDELYGTWVADVTALVTRIEALEFPVDADGERLRTTYRALLAYVDELTAHHFALLNLGYAAYLDLFSFCRQEFPGIPDLAVARMVGSADSDIMRPDRELRRLAQLAVDLGIADAWLVDDSSVPAAVETRLRATTAGQSWLDAWHEVARPWFAMTSGSGFSHADLPWAVDRAEPYRLLHGYLRALRDGRDVAPDVHAVRAENERIAHDYAALIEDPAARDAFDRKLALARTVFPLVENHSFFVEQWGHSAIWMAMRRLGAVLVRNGRLASVDDVFLLGADEVEQSTVGAGVAPDEVRRRANALEALRAWKPPPALGTRVAEVSDPLMAMLWGVTPARSVTWLQPSAAAPGTLTGLAASPGVGEGPARVVHSPAQLAEVRDGEVLVAPVTSPGWAPVFGRVAAIVTDVGGVMSHAAIVCREFGLPAVTGTVDGTRRITTGDRIRVDGTRGTVTVLDVANSQTGAGP